MTPVLTLLVAVAVVGLATAATWGVYRFCSRKERRSRRDLVRRLRVWFQIEHDEGRLTATQLHEIHDDLDRLYRG